MIDGLDQLRDGRIPWLHYLAIVTPTQDGAVQVQAQAVFVLVGTVAVVAVVRQQRADLFLKEDDLLGRKGIGSMGLSHMNGEGATHQSQQVWKTGNHRGE